jgi:hypothetical protein
LPTNDALGEPVCAVHGGFWQESGCLTRAVLEDVAAHRQFQFENYGPNRDVEDGVGPDVDWLAPVVSEFTAGDGSLSARAIEGLFRQEWDYDVNPDPAERTWMRMLREEVAETFASDNAIGLEAELIQVAALAVSWVEKIRERSVSSDV